MGQNLNTCHLLPENPMLTPVLQPGKFLDTIFSGTGIVSSLLLHCGRPLISHLPVPRTREGYYHYAGGIDAAVQRVTTWAPHADLLWLETKEPNLDQARAFARRIREKYPGKYVTLFFGCQHRLNGIFSHKVDGVQSKPQLQLVGSWIFR